MSGPPPLAPLPLPISAPRCHACEEARDTLPIPARFCPLCGRELYPRPPATVIHPTNVSLRERIEQLHAIIREHLDANDEPLPSLDHVHSLTLLGYANALLDLGWRYEHGAGVARNTSEAERCYAKSARLGNVYARARLVDKNVEIPLEDPIPAPPCYPASEPEAR
jgi:TPR repeat protein